MRHPVCWGCKRPPLHVVVSWYRRSAARAMALYLTGETHPMADGRFRPGMSGNLSGRPAGAANKLPTQAKEIVLTAVDILGGANRLAEWARESPDNERALWLEVLPRLLPKQIDTTVDVDTGPRTKEVQLYLVSPTGAIVDPEGRETLDENGRVIRDP